MKNIGILTTVVLLISSFWPLAKATPLPAVSASPPVLLPRAESVESRSVPRKVSRDGMRQRMSDLVNSLDCIQRNVCTDFVGQLKSAMQSQKIRGSEVVVASFETVPTVNLGTDPPRTMPTTSPYPTQLPSSVPIMNRRGIMVRIDGQDLVYDAITPNGIPLSEWSRNLGLGRGTHHDTRFSTF